MIGVVGSLAYTAATYWRLRRKVSTAILLRDNIFQSESVSSPFVLGIIKPKIYLPFKLDGQDMGHVIAHELAHIQRRDHWWKPLRFLLLVIYWFDPLMWLAYALLCRDIELACDEKVIRELGNEQRADYTQALLTCSVSRRMPAACPLALSEVGVKERVKSVMHYKKPAFWIIVLSVVACAVVYFYRHGRISNMGVMLVGTMQVLTEQGIKNEIWHFGDTMFYKKGKTDPDYCVLKFTALKCKVYKDLKTLWIDLSPILKKTQDKKKGDSPGLRMSPLVLQIDLSYHLVKILPYICFCSSLYRWTTRITVSPTWNSESACW